MAKTVVIEVRQTKKADTLSVVFPDKCGNCGKPRAMTQGFEVKQWLKPDTDPVSIEALQVPLQVPHCKEHGGQLQHIRERLERVFYRVLGNSLAGYSRTSLHTAV